MFCWSCKLSHRLADVTRSIFQEFSILILLRWEFRYIYSKFIQTMIKCNQYDCLAHVVLRLVKAWKRLTGQKLCCCQTNFHWHGILLFIVYHHLTSLVFWIKRVNNEDLGPFIYTIIKDCLGLKICITSIAAQYCFDLLNVRNITWYKWYPLGTCACFPGYFVTNLKWINFTNFQSLYNHARNTCNIKGMQHFFQF